MRRFTTGILSATIACIGLSSHFAFADDDDTPSSQSSSSSQPADKDIYNLFNPTPESQLREFNPERPDLTENPHTVDAGHVELEMSFAEYTHDQGTHFDGISVAPVDFRIGILNSADLSIELEPFLYQRQQEDSQTHYASGFGDMQVAWKQNLWGNEGGDDVWDNAFGVIGLVQIPTAAHNLGTGFVQGGVTLPFSMTLPAGFELEADAEFDLNRNDDNTGYGLDFVQSVNLEHTIIGSLSAFAEIIGDAPYQIGSSYQASINSGLTYVFGEDVQLDVAVDFGLSRDTDDYTVISGISIRF